MWRKLADFIFRQRVPLLVAVVALSGWLGFIGVSNFKLSQTLISIVPPEDPDMQEYQKFRELFGEDGNTLVAALEIPKGATWFEPDKLDDLRKTTRKVQQMPGVKSVLNVASAKILSTPDTLQQFVFEPLMPETGPLDAAAAKAVGIRVENQPFYRDLLFDEERRALVTAISLSEKALNSALKQKIVREMVRLFDEYAQQHGAETHYAGIPYVRFYVSTRLPGELAFFMALSLLLTALALYAFYRSFYAVVFPIILLTLSSLCTIGIIGLLGYELTHLTAMLPPIIIILGIPPNIYMLSDYHEEYKKLGDKIAALREMVGKLGLVTLMINANTALGFLTLYLTEVRLLQEFGIVAFFGVMTSFVLAIILIPGMYSLLPAPNDKMLRHLDARFITRFVRRIDIFAHRKRARIYGVTGFFAVLAAGGAFMLEAESYMVDDLPSSGGVYTDLQFMEERFGGVMPFEIMIDLEKPGRARRPRYLKQIRELQDSLEARPEISRTVSIADVMQWSRQAMLGGDKQFYAVPGRQEIDFVELHFANSRPNKTEEPAESPAEQTTGKLSVNNLVDSTWQKARITGFVKDVGSRRLPGLITGVEADIDSIFNKKKKRVEYTVTGVTRIFLKSAEYLIENLKWSLLATFLIIGLQMLLLFRSWRIMVVSLIPNLFALLFTAGVMGVLGIPLKPSTALIYQLAFSIAIDDSIHYLSSYRLFRRRGFGASSGVSAGLRTTGMSITYTSIILFIGFGIFMLSAFGSTRALGILTSSTLLIAMFGNLLLLPRLLIDYDKREYGPEESGVLEP